MQTPRTLEGFDFQFIRSTRHSKGCFSPYLTIILHGRGDCLESFDEIDKELRIEGMNYLLINAPTPFEEGYSWYPFTRRKPKQVESTRRRLIAAINHLESLGWYSENIFVMGHSQGGLMTSDLALHVDRKMAGFITVSGYVHFYPNWESKLSDYAHDQEWLFTHGKKDDVIRISETRKHIVELNQGGIFPSWLEFHKGHEMDHDAETNAIRNWIIERVEQDLILKPRPVIRRAQPKMAAFRAPGLVELDGESQNTVQ